MAPLDFDGGTLGERHQHYNKLLKEAIANRQQVSDFSLDDNDVENLLKIDLACHYRDVDYIMNVFKSGDMLCVSRALSKSTWLVTDQQYSNIINPDYLHNQLLPHMSTKAYIKLKKHVRHNIKDEARAEQFYLHEKELTDAVKWLPHCSVPFIEKNVEKHGDHLNFTTFKRLCEKSITIFEIAVKHVQYYDRTRYAKTVVFLLKVDVDKYLDILDNDNSYNFIPNFSDKATNIIMKNSPKRIIDNFSRYVDAIDIPTFCKYLKTDEIKTFIYTQAQKCGTDGPAYYSLQRLFTYDSLKHFIKRLPKNEQFDFVKKIFIDKENVEAREEDLTVGTESYDMKKLFNVVRTPSYEWYRFATFERAFEDITRLISKDLDNRNINGMMSVLISCADNNLQHIQTLLDYYLSKHKHEEHRLKVKFTTELITNTNIYKYDEKTWSLLNELLKVLNVYDESQDSLPNNVIKGQLDDSIIVYNIIHDLEVPATIKKRFTFRTLKSHQSMLNEEQKKKVFTFLYEFLLEKFKTPVTDEESLTNSKGILDCFLQLLSDWDKQLLDHRFVIDKIKECAKIKKELSLKESLSSLYNFNKSWRKHLFEESFIMNPSEEVCLNALKHKPQLLTEHDQDIETLRTNDAVSLRRVLAKLRVYWPHSLAQQWTDAYLQNLNKTDGHKASIRGLCSVLSRKPLLDIIDKYKPAQAKIDWNRVDDRVLSIQRLLAKNMHIGRPQPNPDSILLYAKGDYLQFALPSLLAIFYNLNVIQSHEYILKLIDAPVSVQKHGIRLAFRRLDHETVKKIFTDCWKASKNVSIRVIIFNFTFELLCSEQDPANIVGLWELLELFIENLTFTEDKKIYEILTSVEKVPLKVRAKYLMKSYKFMKTLVQNVKEIDRNQYEMAAAQLVHHSREIMEDMSPDFVTAVIQEFVDTEFFDLKNDNNYGSVNCDGTVSVISAYLLCAKDENVQTQKYEQVFVPIMKRALDMWAEKRDGKYFIRSHFQCLLTRLSLDLKEYVVSKDMIVPLKMFLNIQTELDKCLSVSENYMLLTKWKLTVAIAKLTNEKNSEGKEWDGLWTEIAPEFGKTCLDYLKQDVKLHLSCIYKLFAKALNELNQSLVPEDVKSTISECMLTDNDFIQGYLTAIEISRETYRCKLDHVWNQILSHPSVEVKMHYYNRNRDSRCSFR